MRRSHTYIYPWLSLSCTWIPLVPSLAHPFPYFCLTLPGHTFPLSISITTDSSPSVLCQYTNPCFSVFPYPCFCLSMLYQSLSLPFPSPVSIPRAPCLLVACQYTKHAPLFAACISITTRPTHDTEPANKMKLRKVGRK